MSERYIGTHRFPDYDNNRLWPRFGAAGIAALALLVSPGSQEKSFAEAPQPEECSDKLDEVEHIYDEAFPRAVERAIEQVTDVSEGPGVLFVDQDQINAEVVGIEPPLDYTEREGVWEAIDTAAPDEFTDVLNSSLGEYYPDIEFDYVPRPNANIITASTEGSEGSSALDDSIELQRAVHELTILPPDLLSRVTDSVVFRQAAEPEGVFLANDSTEGLTIQLEGEDSRGVYEQVAREIVMQSDCDLAEDSVVEASYTWLPYPTSNLAKTLDLASMTPMKANSDVYEVLADTTSPEVAAATALNNAQDEMREEIYEKLEW